MGHKADTADHGSTQKLKGASKKLSTDGRLAALETLVVFLGKHIASEASLAPQEQARLLSRIAAVAQLDLSQVTYARNWPGQEDVG